MTTTTKISQAQNAQNRLGEITEALQRLEEQAATTTSSLGAAVTDSDSKRAASLRDELSKQDARRRELEAVLPIARQRLQEAKEREVREAEIARSRKANKLRAKRLEAARKLDAAWRALARAYGEHESCELGGAPEDHARHASRNERHHRMAAYKWAPALARLIGARPIPGKHRSSLEDCEAATITEFELDDA